VRRLGCQRRATTDPLRRRKTDPLAVGGLILFVGLIVLGVLEHSVGIGLAAALAVGAGCGVLLSRARRARRR
jgi:hypothetical protein